MEKLMKFFSVNMADIRDIMELETPPTPEVTKEFILGGDKPKKKFTNVPKAPKRPEGMHREVFALLYNDTKDAPPLYPTDTCKCLHNEYLEVLIFHFRLQTKN